MRFADGGCAGIPTEFLFQNEVGVIISVDADAKGQVIWL